jgi:heme exporter protein B
LALLEVILGAGVALFYNTDLHDPLLLVAAAVAATLGLAAAGTLYGALASGLRVRETLLPLLLLPIVAPVLIGATRAWEAALGSGLDSGWRWVALLGVFAAVYGVFGSLAFGPLMEDA